MNANPARLGIYSVPDAARITGASPVHIRGWLRGYPQSRGKPAAPPILRQQHEPIAGELALGFLDLLEVRFLERLVEACRRQGRTLAWRALRIAAETARTKFGTEHPFAAKRLHSDGRFVFLEAQKATGDLALYDLVGNNFAIYDVLVASFIASIEYEGDVPRRWRPDEGLPRIVIDPLRAFGQPVEEKSGAPTGTLLDAWQAEGGNAAKIAAYYGTDADGVNEAVRYALGLGRIGRRAA